MKRLSTPHEKSISKLVFHILPFPFAWLLFLSFSVALCTSRLLPPTFPFFSLPYLARGLDHCDCPPFSFSALWTLITWFIIARSWCSSAFYTVLIFPISSCLFTGILFSRLLYVWFLSYVLLCTIFLHLWITIVVHDIMKCEALTSTWSHTQYIIAPLACEVGLVWRGRPPRPDRFDI